MKIDRLPKAIFSTFLNGNYSQILFPPALWAHDLGRREDVETRVLKLAHASLAIG